MGEKFRVDDIALAAGQGKSPILPDPITVVHPRHLLNLALQLVGPGGALLAPRHARRLTAEKLFLVADQERARSQ